MKTTAVIGCGFGDEGKGKVVSYLCSQSKNPLVIRFSGGHQAGHRVVINDNLDHVFSNFGSGTLQGFDTYWSEFCTVDPVGLLNEYRVLKEKMKKHSTPSSFPVLWINERCPVTTPFEKIANLADEEKNKHGSCGVGVGTTWDREEKRYSLLFSDLFSKSIFKIKYELIQNYYLNQDRFNWSKIDIYNDSFQIFLDSVKAIQEIDIIKICDNIPNRQYSEYFFEGSQGLLLDQDIGFFPHVTRGNTGSKNILKMGFEPEIILVSRSYQTRHGAGPMTNDGVYEYINPHEHNSNSGIQGYFRTSPIDVDLIQYGISKDKYIKNNQKTLIITCLDVLNDTFIEQQLIKTMSQKLNINKILKSRKPNNEIEC